MTGFIKDHRKELESDIWSMPPLYHRLWQWLKYSANHEDNTIPMRDGSQMTIKRGQRLTSVRDIAKGISWYEGTKYREPNPKTVATILEWMEKTSMVSIERGQGNRQYTLITLIKYEEYQEKTIQGNSKVTAEKHLADINKNEKNYKNKKELKSSRPKRVYDESEIPYRSAKFLFEQILTHKPDLKKPDLQKWSDSMRKLIDIDGRDPVEVGKVIQWVVKDSFWSSNILSAETLRGKWDQLTAKMNKPTDGFPKGPKQEAARMSLTSTLQTHIPSEEDMRGLEAAYNKLGFKNSTSP